MGRVVGDVEALKSKILEQAREQVTSMLDRARRVSERDLVYAKEEADEIISRQRAAVQPMAEAQKRRTLVGAQMEARRKLLEKKEELVSRAFAEAEKQLEKTRGTEIYTSIISRLIEDGAASIKGDVIVEFSGKDRKTFTPEFISSIESLIAGSPEAGVRLQFKCVGDVISAGVMIRSGDGRVIIDSSFSGILKRLRENLRGKVSEMLLEE